MQTEPTAAGRARSDTSARRRARPNVPRLKQPTPPPDLLPAPVDARGRPFSSDRLKWKVTRVLLQEGLSSEEIAFAIATLDFSPGGQLTTASMKTIAKRAGMGRSTGFKVRAGLVARGVLTTEPQYDDDGAQITSKHAIAPAVFERAEVFFSWPPPSTIGTGPRPGSGHKRDPLSDLDPSSGSGSLDLTENGNQHARERAIPSPVFVSSNDDPAFVLLVTLHAAAHEDKYRPEAERRGEVYDPRDAGTLRREHRADVAAELRALAERAHGFALSKHRDDLTVDAIRAELTAAIVRDYMRQNRRWVRDRKHCLGGLWAADEDKPRELRALGLRAFEAWCDALDPGEPPPLHELLERADIEAARAACAELRARLDAERAAGELPAPLPELDQEHDDQEHDDQEHDDTAPLSEPPPRADVPPRGQRVTAEIRAELMRIDAEARERAEARRAQRPRIQRGGRAPLATRPRERLAILAALIALAAPLATLDGPEHDPPDESPAAAPWTAAAAPLLRDARERPARRAPRRRRAPPERP